MTTGGEGQSVRGYSAVSVSIQSWPSLTPSHDHTIRHTTANVMKGRSTMLTDAHQTGMFCTTHIIAIIIIYTM